MHTLSKVELIIYDFDGIMTDNSVLVNELGQESVKVSRADGLAISYIKEMNIDQIIISTESNPIVTMRANKLKIKVMQNIDNKLSVIKKLIKEKKYDLSKVIYVGNDINDLDSMKFVGIPIAPADAHQDIKSIAKYIVKSKGGEGVVRDLFDLINNNSILL